MYSIIKNIIQNGNFRVNDLTTKIDTLWAESKLSDEERDELMQMMSDYLNPATEAPELAERINQLEDKIEAVETAIKELQGDVEEPDPEQVVIPQWKAWDGVSSDYQYGDVVQHNGLYYVDVLQSMQNTWEPGSAGVDSRYWMQISQEDAEDLILGIIEVGDVTEIKS